MSPKFGLALLLICFVLLGLSDAQRQQRQQYQPQQRQQQRPRYRNGGEYTDIGEGFGGANGSPPPIDNGGVDCNQNILAGGGRDRFSRKH